MASIALKIIAFTLLFIGFALVYAAKFIVNKFDLDKDVTCEFDHEMTEEELLQYKNNKAVLKYKIRGLLIAIPGLILIMVLFR